MISEALQELAKVNFSKISVIESEIGKDKGRAIDFISDPNRYMRQAMAGEYLPTSLHFHVRSENSTFPADTEIPDNQIVISSYINLDVSFRDEVVALIKSSVEASIPVKPLYCEGCARCYIAIIK